MRLPFPAKWVKVGERGLMAGVTAFVATYSPVILSADSLHSLLDLSVADRAATAGVAAVFMLVVSALGLKVGDKESPSVLAGLANDK